MFIVMFAVDIMFTANNKQYRIWATELVLSDIGGEKEKKVKYYRDICNDQIIQLLTRVSS